MNQRGTRQEAWMSKPIFMSILPQLWNLGIGRCGGWDEIKWLAICQCLTGPQNGKTRRTSWSFWAPKPTALLILLHTLTMASLSPLSEWFRSSSWSIPLPPLLNIKHRWLTAALNKWLPFYDTWSNHIMGGKFPEGQKAVNHLCSEIWEGESFKQHSWRRLVSSITLIPSMKISFALVFLKSFWRKKPSVCCYRIFTAACLTFVNFLLTKQNKLTQAHGLTQARRVCRT